MFFVHRIYTISSPQKAVSNPRQLSFRCSICPYNCFYDRLSSTTDQVTQPNNPTPRPSFLTKHANPSPDPRTNFPPSTPRAQAKPSPTHLSPSTSPPDSSQQTTTSCPPKTHPHRRKTQPADHPRSVAFPRLPAGSQEPVCNRAEGRREGTQSVAWDMCRLLGRVGGGLRLANRLYCLMGSFGSGSALGLRL